MSSPGPALREVLPHVCFGVFEFHPSTLELKRAGHPVRLQELPARLLTALLRNPGSLVTREQLQAELWPSNTFVQFDAGLNTAMNKLRLALRDSADNPSFIATVPRTGYRFIAPVRRPEPRPVLELPKPSPPQNEPPLPEPAVQPETPPPAERPIHRPARRWPWVAIALLLCVSAALAFLILPARFANSGPAVRFAIDLPPGQEFKFYTGRHIGISPDGETIAWIAISGGVRQIYVRKLQETVFRPLPGTDRATSLGFSPKGDWVAYISEAGELRKASVDGRWNLLVLPLGAKSQHGTVLWGADGWIYFSSENYQVLGNTDSRGVHRVRADGGKPEALLPQPQPAGAWFPHQLLPQGLLCSIDYAPTDEAITYLPFADRKVRQWIAHASGGRYLPTGHLIFDQSGNLMAVPFDAARMQVTGKPVLVVPDVAPDRYAGLQMDVSETGTLVYFRSTIVHEREPVWVDKEGHESKADLPLGRYHLLDLSADGRRLLATRFDAGDHWVMSSFDLNEHTSIKIQSDDSPGTGAIWSPDGRSVAIAARYQQEIFDTLYVKPLDTTGGERPLLADAYSGKYPQSWSRAANAIAYSEGYHEKTKRDIYVLPLQPGARPQCIACSPEDDVFPSFSPDGQWIAYTSAVSGHFEIYAQRYPSPSQPVQLSPDGGKNSLWAPSGHELYYLRGSEMWAVGFDPHSGRPGKARKLFSGRYDAGNILWNRDMLLSPDGNRFLMLKMKDDPPDYRRIQVVLNWFPELRRTVQ